VQHFLLFDRMRRSDEEVAQALAVLEQQAAQPGQVRAAQLLGLAYETGAGRPQDPGKALLLYGRCGDDVFARKGLVRLALGGLESIDLVRLSPTIVAAVAQQDAEASYYLAWLHLRGRGAVRDVERARALLAAAARAVPAAQQLLGRDLTGPLPTFTPPRLKQLTPPPWSSAFPLP
jgi:TPR repeat protein